MALANSSAFFLAVALLLFPYALGWSDEKYIRTLKGRINSASYDGSMIMGCLAEANRGTIDALTALAEMPETVRSIYNGIKTCLRMYGDAVYATGRHY